MNAKPIVVITLNPNSVDPSRGMADLLNELDDVFSKKLPDYHVLPVPGKEEQEYPLTFQVFYSKDFTEVQYEELKKIIQQSTNQL